MPERFPFQFSLSQPLPMSSNRVLFCRNKKGIQGNEVSEMHVGQQCTAALKRSLCKFNRNKHNGSVKGKAESALGTWQGQTPRQASARSHSPLTTCQELLKDTFASLLQLTSWLSSLPPPPAPQIGNKPHFCQKNFWTISFLSNPRI